ncbi:MAG: DUF3244 domain-containing protein [Paludibacteraceae bacterium]|nr:DUF3244 domain-containing protein [Paludibacteraceae bacterium]MDD6747780.1 DUF3244 domain-containing protein [Paludibacteraceae bacterium]
MRKCFLFVALSALLAMPCILRAQEVEIQLVEVIQMTPLPGEDPLDGNDHMIPTPTRPTDFRATINGNTLSIEKREAAIPSAQATVVNVATGGVVVNQQFTTTLSEQISAQGVYALRIETAGGALVGQFIVQ